MKRFHHFLLTLNVLVLQSYLLRFSILNYPSNLQEILLFLQIIVFVWVTHRAGKFKKRSPKGLEQAGSFSGLGLVGPKPEKLTLAEDLLENNLERKGVYVGKTAGLPHGISEHWILLFFVFLTIFSALTNPILSQLDFFRYLKFLFFALILVFIFLETWKTEIERRQGLRFIALGALIFGIFSVAFNFLGYNVTYDHRLQGPLDAAVYLAYYLAPAFLYFLIEWFEQPQYKFNLLYAVLAGLLLLATRSMGAIAAVFLVLLIYFLKRKDIKLLHSKISKMMLALIFIIIFGAIFYTKILPSFQTNNTSLGERDEIWVTAFDLLKNPRTFFLGLGPAQFEYHYIQNVERVIGHKPLDYHIIQPHNLFFLFLFNYGILGLIFLLFCMMRVVQIFIKSPGAVGVQSFACLLLFYFFLHGMIDTPIFKNDLLIIFMLLLELAVADTNP